MAVDNRALQRVRRTALHLQCSSTSVLLPAVTRLGSSSSSGNGAAAAAAAAAAGHRHQLLGPEQLRDFVSRGVIVVQLDDLPHRLHAHFGEKALAMSSAAAAQEGKQQVRYGNPAQAIGAGLEEEMISVFRSGRFQGALHSLLGPDFRVGNNWEDDGTVGYSYRMHVSREAGQQWHMDGTDHGNTQSTVRELHMRQLMAFYYPLGATLAQGPTAVVSNSHYYNVNREGRGSSEDSLVPIMDPAASTEEQATDHWFSGRGPPIRMLTGGAEGGDPLLQEVKLVVPPGTVVLCGHHTFHRATKRLRGSAAPPRLMFKLNMASVSEPSPLTTVAQLLPLDRRGDGGDDVTHHHPVWSSALARLCAVPSAPPLAIDKVAALAWTLRKSDSEVWRCTAHALTRPIATP
jgi:hypothetical protein